MSRALGAAIFDMDGVLVDSEPLHERAVRAVLRRRGHRLESKEYAALVGLNQPATWAWVAQRYGLSEDPERYEQEYLDDLLDLLSEPIDPLPGAAALLQSLADRALPLAVATSSQRTIAHGLLQRLRLTSYFRVVVTGDQVMNGKPEPDIYCLAAARLGVAARSCLAFEDSGHGVASAKAAGMTVVAVRNRYAHSRLRRADFAVDSLEELLIPGRLDNILAAPSALFTPPV